MTATTNISLWVSSLCNTTLTLFLSFLMFSCSCWASFERIHQRIYYKKQQIKNNKRHFGIVCMDMQTTFHQSLIACKVFGECRSIPEDGGGGDREVGGGDWVERWRGSSHARFQRDDSSEMYPKIQKIFQFGTN